MHVEELKDTNEEFLPELRRQFEQYMALRSYLDTKATNSITMSSAIVTVLVAIGTFLVTKIDNAQPIFIPLAIILGGGILCDIIGIIYFVKSYIIKGYRYPMGHKAFFDKDTGNRKIDVINTFIDYSKERFKNHLIIEYLDCIRENGKSNESKAASIRLGQYLFIASMCCIVLILLLVMASLASGNKIMG
jgi:hypothetical protein